MKIINVPIEPLEERYSEQEEWKTIKAFPGYEVSNFGRVRKGDFVLKNQTMKKNGYKVVNLYDGNNNYKTVTVHKLVAEEFMGPCPKGYQVNHKDTNKTNNRDSNLEYMTPIENTVHAMKSGCWDTRLKLNPEKVKVIRVLLVEGSLNTNQIAKQFGVSGNFLRKIRDRKVWKNV